MKAIIEIEIHHRFPEHFIKSIIRLIEVSFGFKVKLIDSIPDQLLVLEEGPEDNSVESVYGDKN